MTRRSTSRTTRRRIRRRRSSSAPPGRRIRRCRSHRRTCSATTATAPSGTPASVRSPTRSSAGARPRSSWTTTASAGRPAAGIIADFCAVGGKITKRVFPPLNTTDYSSYVQQLPPPDTGRRHFWVVGGTGTAASLTAYEQAYGPLDPKKHIGNLFFAFLGADKVVGPEGRRRLRRRLRHRPGPQDGAGEDLREGRRTGGTRASTAATTPTGSSTTTSTPRGRSSRASRRRRAQIGAALQASMPKTLRVRLPGLRTAASSSSTRTGRRSRTSTRCSSSRTRTAASAPRSSAYVPNVDQSFGGLFKTTSPPPGRTQPPCVKKRLPWQGKIKVVKNGVITTQVIK